MLKLLHEFHDFRVDIIEPPYIALVARLDFIKANLQTVALSQDRFQIISSQT